MKHRARKMLGIGLCVAMVIGLIPWSVLTNAKADTATGKTIAGLGTSPIGNPTKSGQWHYVYYGKYNINPVKYRVLSIKTTDFGGTTMLLDCDSTLYTAAFDSNSNRWENSSIKTELNGDLFLTKEGVFTPAESNAIAFSTKATKNNDHDGSEWWNTSGNYGLYYAPLKGQKIFLLDAVEATSSTYGYTDVSRKKSGASTPWWLRSPLSNDVSGAGIVFDNGDLGCVVINNVVGVSPALNINLSSVIFSSLISGTAGQPGAEYKLTVKDQDESGNVLMSISSDGASQEGSSQAGNVYSIPYSISGTNAKNATQVSVVVTTSTWTDSGWSSTDAPLQYTKLDMDNFSAKGTGSFTLDKNITGTWGTNFHVYLVAEDVNSEKATDYASLPVEIQIKNSVVSVDVTFKVVGGGWDSKNGSTDDIVIKLTRGENEDKALVLADTDIPTAGNSPSANYKKEGSWGTAEPTTDRAFSEDTTYTYTYTAKTAITPAVSMSGYMYGGTPSTPGISGNTGNGAVTYYYGTENKSSDVTEWNPSAPPQLNAGDYYLYATVAETEEYASAVTAPVAFTVSKRDVSLESGSGEKTYDGIALTKPDVTMSGSGFVAGEVSDLKATGSVTNVAEGEVDNTITWTANAAFKAENYAITKTEGKLKINPKSITGAPVELDNTKLTYNGSEQTVNVTGVTINGLSLMSSDYDVSGNKGINVGEYDLTVTGKGNFEGEAKTKWTIVEKEMTVTAKGFAGEYDGQAHGIKVTVMDPASGAVVKYGKEAGTYDLDESPTITDAGTLTVYFKVTAENYADHTGSATVTIAKAGAAVVTTVPTAKDLTYTGNAQELVTAGAASGGTVQYAPGVDASTIPADGWSETVPVGTLPGTYYVWYKAVGDIDHDDGDAACVTAEIKKATITATAAGYTGAYDGQAHGITVTVTVPAEGAVVKYGSVEGSYDLDASPTMTDAGTLTVYFRVTAENYADNTGSAIVTIGKTDAAVVTAPTAKDLTYTGAAQELVTAGAASGGTMQYALGADTTTAPAEGWSVAVPGGTDPGTYYVWYKVAGDADHNDTAAACVTAAIKKADAVVTVAPTAVAGLVATGAPQTLVTAGTASGGEMQYALGADAVTTPAAGWSTAISTGTDAGIYYIWYKAVGDANHNDSASGCVTVTIGVKEQINISKAKIGKVKNQTYTGKKIKPELQVILGDTVLVQGVDYDVKVDNKKIGYATARAVGKDDYTGKTKKVTFKIVPKPVKDKKIKVEKKGKNIEVSWKKNGKKLDGYEIQVSTNENFKKDTNKWIGIYDTKKTKFLVTSLEVGKTYYFRVRCYKYVKNGKDTEKFHSEWSETAMIELK